MMNPLAAIVPMALTATVCAQDPALDPDAAGPAQRIWAADMQQHQEVWLRRRFALPEKVTSARFVFTCDNECALFVNGVERASSVKWEEVTVVDLDDLGRDNAVAVHAKNTGGPAAFACWVLWTDAKGVSHSIVTDADWRVAVEEVVGWTETAFDHKAWKAATANFTSTYGLNLYNGKPLRVVFRNAYAEAADEIERALLALRKARDRKAALRALDAVEKAMVAARTKIWAEKEKAKPPQQGAQNKR